MFGILLGFIVHEAEYSAEDLQLKQHAITKISKLISDGSVANAVSEWEQNTDNSIPSAVYALAALNTELLPEYQQYGRLQLLAIHDAKLHTPLFTNAKLSEYDTLDGFPAQYRSAFENVENICLVINTGYCLFEDSQSIHDDTLANRISLPLLAAGLQLYKHNWLVQELADKCMIDFEFAFKRVPFRVNSEELLT